jgi:hypothetical protein
MKSKIFLLKVSALSHSYFTMGSIIFIAGNALGFDNPLLDIAAILTFLSFILFKRCVMIDIYNTVKQDHNEMDLPMLARDSSTREFIKSITRNFVKPKDNPVNEDRIHSMRLDILKNVEPFIEEDDRATVRDMYNRKIQYICGNIILGMSLISKYGLYHYSIFIVMWLLYTFPI